jgi:hypothetical protein
MVTFQQLKEADTGAVKQAAQAWSQLAKDMGQLEERVVAELTGKLRGSGWSGPAADAAFTVCDSVDDEYELTARQTLNAAAVIRQAGSEFGRVQARLREALGTAADAGLRVDANGVVHAADMTSAERHDPDGQDQYWRAVDKARVLTSTIESLLTAATDLDERFAAALKLFSPSQPGQMSATEWNNATADAREALALLGMSEGDIPSGDDTGASKRWWDSLSEAERSLYLAAYPERVGALDGLPTPARDDANKMALRNLIGAHLNEHGDPRDPEHERLTNLLRTLEGAEHGPAPQRLYLLGIDNANDGRAIVAVGNPDTAAHTAVVIPGITTELDDMDGQISRAGALRQTADDLTAGADGDVAVVAWLGYDTPGQDASAVRGHHAEAGAPLLDRFTDGLRTAHEPGDARLTIVGHSYGSTVVGTAASQGDGLAADDIIVAGSPGMRVDNVSDLKIDPKHVWAGAAEGDDVSGWLSHFAHGPEPHEEEFGANRYHVDTTGHSDYWKPDSESLRNQALIVIGEYDRVTLDHGTRP